MSDVLRVVVGAFGVLMLGAGLLLFAAGGQLGLSGIYPFVLGVIALATAIFERSRYWPRRGGGEEVGLKPTEERFIDPTTGERTRVWIDPSSGERTYQPDDEGQPQK